jgi:hypothetical protein
MPWPEFWNPTRCTAFDQPLLSDCRIGESWHQYEPVGQLAAEEVFEVGPAAARQHRLGTAGDREGPAGCGAAGQTISQVGPMPVAAGRHADIPSSFGLTRLRIPGLGKKLVPIGPEIGGVRWVALGERTAAR